MKKHAKYAGVVAGIASLAVLSTTAAFAVNASAAAPTSAVNSINAAQSFTGAAFGQNGVSLSSSGVASSTTKIPTADSWGNFILTEDSVAPQLAAGSAKPGANLAVDNSYGVGAAEFGNSVSFNHDFTLTYSVDSTNVSAGQGDGLVFVPTADGSYSDAMQTANNGGAGIAGLANAFSFFHQANVTGNSSARANGAWIGANSANKGYSSFRYTDSTGALVPATDSSLAQVSANGAQANWTNAASGSAWDDQFNGSGIPVQYTVKYSASTGQLTVTQTNGTYNPNVSGYGFTRGGILGSIISRYMGTITGLGNGGQFGAVAGIAGVNAIGQVANAIGWAIGAIPVVLLGWFPLLANLGWDLLAPLIAAVFYGVEGIVGTVAGTLGAGIGAAIGGGMAQASVKNAFSPVLNVFGNTQTPTMLGVDPTKPNVLGTPSDTVYTTTIPQALRGDSYNLALVAAKGSSSSSTGNTVGAATNQLEINNYDFGE